MRGRLWTEEELDLLRTLVDVPITDKELRDTYFPDRSVCAIANMRSRCRNGKDRLSIPGGLKQISWTDASNQILLSNYANMTIGQIQATYFPDRSYRAIQCQLQKLIGNRKGCHNRVNYKSGVVDIETLSMNDADIRRMVDSIITTSRSRVKNTWTSEELFYLIKYHGTMSAYELSEMYLPDRSVGAIHSKAVRIGITGEHTEWTSDSDNLLRQLYCSGLNIVEMADRLHRTEESVRRRLSYIDCCSENCRRWTDDEDETLRHTMNLLSPSKIAGCILPNRTTNSIKTRISKLTRNPK